ncbi:cation:dicarboxylate symporter family transporter [Streptomyces sp. L7]
MSWAISPRPSDTIFQFLGDIFVHLIQMVVGLIIFCTVTHGIAGVRDLGKVGRIAVRSLVYFPR